MPAPDPSNPPDDAAASTAHAADPPFSFDLDGGRACLDFANSLDSSGEHLATYTDLIAFADQSRLITPSDVEWLHLEARRQPDAARAVLLRARGVRDAIQAIFRRVAAGETPAETDLSLLNVELAASLCHARLRSAGSPAEAAAFQWAWSEPSLDMPIWPVTRSAAEVLVSDDERRLVRECGSATCAWLFLDSSKNRSRQWCSMRSCGNREKARRHYQRVRATRDLSA